MGGKVPTGTRVRRVCIVSIVTVMMMITTRARWQDFFFVYKSEWYLFIYLWKRTMTNQPTRDIYIYENDCSPYNLMFSHHQLITETEHQQPQWLWPTYLRYLDNYRPRAVTTPVFFFLFCAPPLTATALRQRNMYYVLVIYLLLHLHIIRLC